MTRTRYPLIILLGLSLVACTEDGNPSTVGSQPPPPPGVTAQASAPPKVASVDVLAKGLRAPWAVAWLPDGTALVTERDTKRIMRVAQGTGHDAPFTASQVAVIDDADPHGEGGLMGIAVSPNYAQDQLIFLYYTTANDNRIARWRLGGGQPEPIVTGIPAAGNHNGGRLAIGPDKFLYASTGDAGSGRRAQDLKDLGGKVLRMTLDGKPAPGNPFNTLVWSYGHRNVQGLAWDRWGKLWATEFGTNTWDEFNVIEPGKNYGWPNVEGAGNDNRFVNPLFTFPTGESSCSGATIAGDTFIAACLRGQRLILVGLGPDGATSQPVQQLIKEYGRLRAAVTAPDNSVWVLTNNHDGRCNSGCTKHPDDDRILKITVGD
ncbi:MAG TPA: PQQ-dependent sugar dehydrogenase [Candidatus Limnocylindrales bacterium]